MHQAEDSAAANQPATRGAALPSALLLAIAYLGFVSIGLPDTVAGVAWPSVRDTFALPQSGFGLIFVALGCGYCASAFVGGRLMLALGIGTLLTVSSALVVAAMFGFASAPLWPWFVGCAIVWGLGSGAIDTGLNAYVSAHFSAKHVNWLHACYSLGATLGPLLMTAVIVRAESWRAGYATVGMLILVMTILFVFTRRAWGEPPKSTESEAAMPASMAAALRQPLVWLQIVVFFLYVGLEFTVGQWSFTLLTESRGIHTDVAGVLAASYYGAIGVGRVLFGMIADRVGIDRLLRYATLGALIGALVFTFAPMQVRDVGLVVIGLGLAPVFPCMMARTPSRLSAYATHAFGFQVSAGMLGAALVPGLAGLLVEGRGLEVVAQFAVLLAAMLFATHELLLGIAKSSSE